MKARAFVAVAFAAVVTTARAADVTPVRTHVVEIRQFAFFPDTIAVVVGDTIRWINRDPVPHTATATDGRWGSGRLESGAEWSMVIGRDAAGRYVCEYHPNMKAMVQLKR